MADFFVIADEEIVLGFRLVGVEGRSVSGAVEALDAFRFATGRGADPSGRPYRGIGAKVLVLSEDIADLIEEEAKEWQLGGALPLIVEIPSRGQRRAGRKTLIDAVREAVGVSI